ncbi:MAG TPA: hypothetical protein VLW85_21600 [Myxococcales bacterium]|nr:hypothetical protein [Myxococcales bacterium]
MCDAQAGWHAPSLQYQPPHSLEVAHVCVQMLPLADSLNWQTPSTQLLKDSLHDP